MLLCRSGMRSMSVVCMRKCACINVFSYHKQNRFCFYAELRSTGTAHHFAYLLNASDYRILRMDEDHDRMYVGSKDHILSLDLHDINKSPHIVRLLFMAFTMTLIWDKHLHLSSCFQAKNTTQRSATVRWNQNKSF